MNVKSLRTGLAATLGGAVLLAGLLVGASIALADDADTSTDEPRSEKECQFGGLDGLLPLKGHLDDIADELGIELDEVREQLAAGATLEEIAESQGLDLDSVIETLKERALEAIDERVADGDLTEDQANGLRERIEAFELGEFSFREFRGRLPGGFEFHGFGDMRGFGGFFGDFDLDLDLTELRERLESGMTLPESLEDLGVDVDEILTDARSSALERIDELVEEGIITQERADEIRETLEGFNLDEGFPGLFGHDRGFGKHWRHHGEGFGFFGPDRNGEDTVEAEDAIFSA